MSQFPDITQGIKGLVIAILIMLPLAIWKLCEIAVWLIQHLEISLK